MTTDNGVSQQQLNGTGAHRTPRKRSALTRTIAAGGAVVCIGVVYEMTAPTVHALSIVFRSPQANGTTDEVRINALHGNIFDPQLGLLGGNASNNSTTGNGAFGTVNNPLINNPIVNNPILRLLVSLWEREIVFGSAASGPVSNTTQLSFGSFNIFNPQTSLFGGNVSNNTTTGNVALGNGNNTDTSVTSVPSLWTSWFGGMTGSGNTTQLALFSGNIFNPQWSLFGPNVSNNTAITNVAANNGNYSQTSVTQGGGLLGAVARFFLGGMTGNGNTTQTAIGTSNITNPQVSIAGSNQSNNMAITNDAIGNGNSSQTTVNGSGNVISTGTTGNGNTNQTAIGTSNIENTQVSIGDIGLTPRPAELSTSQSGSQLTTTSTTPTSSSASSTDSQSSSAVGTSSQTGSSALSAPESGSGASGSGGTSGAGGTSGSGGSGESGGSESG
jgi:hypothetical protein